MSSLLENLPKDRRGFPIPWFVSEKKENGEPDFVKIHPLKAYLAVLERRCWICGGLFGNRRNVTFVCGPLSVATRHVSEPPMHLECARFAVKTCPFMLHPNYRRSWTTMSDMMPGLAVDRNPAVSLLCTVSHFRVKMENTGPLYTLPAVMRLEAWREGRAATRDEYLTSLEEGRELVKAKGGAEKIPLKVLEELNAVFDEARGAVFENTP